jgi:hypothetical protein
MSELLHIPPWLVDRWAHAFFYTLIIEVPVFVVIARTAPVGERPAYWRAALGAAFGTCLTHPTLWFVWRQVIHDYSTYIITGELLVSIIEAGTFYLMARPIRLSRAIAAAFIANACSYGSGQLFRFLGWW